MAINKVYAEMAVRDFTAAVAWYGWLFDRPADTAPMAGLAEWQLVECGGIQVFQDKDRAGSSWVTLAVSSLDDQLVELKAKGLAAGPTTKTEYLKTVTVADPDGNHLTFVEALTANN